MGSGRPEIVFLCAYVPSSCTEQASSNVGWIKNDSVSVKKALLASGKENVDWSDFFEFIASPGLTCAHAETCFLIKRPYSLQLCLSYSPWVIMDIHQTLSPLRAGPCLFPSLAFHHWYLHDAWLIATETQSTCVMNEWTQFSNFCKCVHFFMINFLEHSTLWEKWKAYTMP